MGKKETPTKHAPSTNQKTTKAKYTKKTPYTNQLSQNPQTKITPFELCCCSI